jgi:hypothetical protein
MEYMIQCKLESNGKSVVTFISEDGAEVGKSMLFKNEGADRWTVVEVYKDSRSLKADIANKRSNVFDSIKPKK